MEKIIKQLAVIGVAGAMTLNLGCDLDVEDPTGPGFAPLSLNGKSVAFTGIETESDDSISIEGGTVTFTAPTFTMTSSDGSPENGNYKYEQTSGTSGKLTLTESDGSDAMIILMIFTSPTRGSYSVSDTGDGSEHGVFQQTN